MPTSYSCSGCWQWSQEEPTPVDVLGQNTQHQHNFNDCDHIELFCVLCCTRTGICPPILGSTDLKEELDTIYFSIKSSKYGTTWRSSTAFSFRVICDHFFANSKFHCLAMRREVTRWQDKKLSNIMEVF